MADTNGSPTSGGGGSSGTPSPAPTGPSGGAGGDGTDGRGRELRAVGQHGRHRSHRGDGRKLRLLGRHRWGGGAGGLRVHARERVVGHGARDGDRSGDDSRIHGRFERCSGHHRR